MAAWFCAAAADLAALDADFVFSVVDDTDEDLLLLALPDLEPPFFRSRTRACSGRSFPSLST